MDIFQHPYFKVDPRIFYRYLAFVGFLHGEFTFAEFLSLLLPSALVKRKREIGMKAWDYFERYQGNLIKKYLNPDGSVTLYSHPFYTASYGELVILIQQVIVSDQYNAKRFVKGDAVVIDAGANIGSFSVKVAHDFPNATVYAVEPSSETFAILKKNVAPYPKVVPVNAGLGDREAKKEMKKYRNQLGTARIEDAKVAPHDPGLGEIVAETVTVTTIDALARDRRIPRVDFIKMDTEGYEERILGGAAETIRKWKPAIVMSAYHTPTDKTDLPRVVKEICPDYVCELHREAEEDLVCYVKKT